MAIHNINPFRHRVFFSTKRLNPKQDIIFNFANSTIDGQQVPLTALEMHKFMGIIATHLTHYFIGTLHISSYIKNIPHNLLITESNLANYPFFKTFFPDVKKTYTLPFVVKARYKKTSPSFTNRINKCFAIGTLFEAKSKEYKEFFGNKPFHPMRQAIYEHQEKLKDTIDSYITSLDKTVDLKEVFPEDPWNIRLAKHVLPYVLLENIVPNHKNKYFSFDIVEKYNEYRMFISPEEIIGLPSINAIEGMACGSAFIGIEDPMYTDLGLIPNVHYIAYKNEDLSDLVGRIEYYQQHPKECEAIAERGYEYVTSNYTATRVAQVLWKDLESTLNTQELKYIER